LLRAVNRSDLEVASGGVTRLLGAVKKEWAAELEASCGRVAPRFRRVEVCRRPATRALTPHDDDLTG